MDLEYEIDDVLCPDPKNDPHYYTTYRNKLIELYKHCMKHNKYDAYLYLNVLHAFSHVNTDRAVDKLLEIKDDKELAIACNFLAFMRKYGTCNGTLGFETRQPILERLIDYFKHDYEYSEWRSIFEKMFLNIDYDEIEYCEENEFSIFLNLIIYRMFLQYDEDFLYPKFSYVDQADVFGYLIPKDKNIEIMSEKYNELLLKYK